MARFSGVKVLTLLTELAEVVSEDDNFVPNGQEIEKLAKSLFDDGGLESVGVKPSEKSKGIVDMVRNMARFGFF